jgi:hypothetical protein
MGSSLEEMKGKLADSERMAARHEAEKKQLLGRLEDEMRKGDVIRLGVQIEYDVVHLRTSLVQLFVLLHQN